MSTGSHAKTTLSRRQLLKAGGTSILGLGLLPIAAEAGPVEDPGPILDELGDLRPLVRPVDDILRIPGIRILGGGLKPVYLVEDRSTDAALHSRAESLFWTEIMAEHALFLSLYLAGPENTVRRRQATAFHGTLSGHARALRTAPIQGDYREQNQATIDLVEPLLAFKRKLAEDQSGGRLHSLGFVSFYEHAAQEGEKFIDRLQQLSAGRIVQDRARVLGFWRPTMAEHGQLVAHLLDPSEVQRINQALTLARDWLALQDAPALTAVNDLLEETLGFHTDLSDGVRTGRVRSVLHPQLADHVRREALKFQDELNRSA